ncbi:rubrerythrin family protein [Clostridium chauvoei]|uniref:Rubrerythrin family protein n=2 Tax=Clostridium chauvoei TaxID=46867 RepID=A0ABD4RFL8_9CLOT|nr:rubrerythrin family protein [Clostridium chauvoei]ATD55821.1 rubrerythrin family protein [Clostridium chauvoei]ATD56505.1 rubrerythrin family protein [Clostridium chauvoei]MBX7280179.1 rubrerythrin family protein [Clostridium chauvoei]MBX7282711.1 rubrerythrin family protein [Clostridium chauvoei]MBX7285070.1 rubrerythrin family protein [Clostridium chauvoei]
MDLKGSKTEKNLYRTFAGESRARNKYNLYATKAREEGYQWVGEIFDVTAMNEFAHAREVYKKYLGLVGTTKENLIDAIMGETEEYKDLYKRFEREAREEGFMGIADFYKELAEVEEHHQERYKKLYDKLEDGTMFKGPEESKWICMNCGYIHEGSDAPLVCPLCKYPRAYFKPYCEITNA